MPPFRQGVKDTQFPPVPMLLSQKTLKKNYILVGRDEAQVRFAEEFLGIPCVDAETVKDENLLGTQVRQLLRTETSRSLDISADVIAHTGIFEIAPITDGSAGLNAIIRYAAGLLNRPYTKELAARTSKAVLEERTDDIGVLIWQAVWVLTGPLPEEGKRWPYPWESLRGWVPADVDVSYRLNTLYKDLVGHVFIRKGESETAIKKLNIPPFKLKELQKFALDLKKVDASIQELSRWRSQRYSPFVCAAKVTRIWELQ